MSELDIYSLLRKRRREKVPLEMFFMLLPSRYLIIVKIITVNHYDETRLSAPTRHLAKHCVISLSLTGERSTFRVKV